MLILHRPFTISYFRRSVKLNSSYARLCETGTCPGVLRFLIPI